VISIGRTVLLAGAMGKPCLVNDIHGCDGWLTADSLDLLATRNFSGRVHHARLSCAQLERQLFSEAARLDVQPVMERLFAKLRAAGAGGDHRPAVPARLRGLVRS